MRKILERAPLIFSVAVALCFVSFLGGFYLKEKETLLVTNSGDTPLISENISSGLKDEEETSQPAAEEPLSETVSASRADAIGRINEQFLSPYSAQLNFDGVYVKNSTGLSVDLKSELATPPEIKLKKSSEPEVLILHTHTTESYMPEDRNFYTAEDKSRSTDNSKNMVAVGEAFAEEIRSGGFTVIHDTTQHDQPSYNGSYSKAYETITEYLKQYPSIKIVVDVHRDAVSSGGTKTKPTVKIDGQKAAQVMLVVGSQTGSVSNFPNWKQNFRLSIRFQQAMEKAYPGLARTMMFSSNRYNMHLTTGSMLLEVGTDANTLDEACYSAKLAGRALTQVLDTLR